MFFDLGMQSAIGIAESIIAMIITIKIARELYSILTSTSCVKIPDLARSKTYPKLMNLWLLKPSNISALVKICGYYHIPPSETKKRRAFDSIQWVRAPIKIRGTLNL